MNDQLWLYDLRTKKTGKYPANFVAMFDNLVPIGPEGVPCLDCTKKLHVEYDVPEKIAAQQLAGVEAYEAEAAKVAEKVEAAAEAKAAKVAAKVEKAKETKATPRKTDKPADTKE